MQCGERDKECAGLLQLNQWGCALLGNNGKSELGQ